MEIPTHRAEMQQEDASGRAQEAGSCGLRGEILRSIDFVRAVHEFAHVEHVCAARWITQLGVSVAQGNVLLQLNEVADVSASDLAKALGLSKASVGRVVRSLTVLRLVEAPADPFDRRATALRLTELGRSICAHLLQIRRAANAEVLAGIDENDLMLFVRILHRMKTNAQRIRPFEMHRLFANAVQ